MPVRLPIAAWMMMVTGLVLAGGQLAHGGKPPPQTSLAGHYTYAGDQSEQAHVLAEVDSAVNKMNFFIRLWAKPKLVGDNRIPKWIRFSIDDGPTWNFETALSPPWRAKPDGDLFAIENAAGDSVQMRWHLDGAKFVQQYLRKGTVTRVVTFLLSSDQTHLSMTVVCPKTESLEPIEYTLTYKRTRI